MAQEPRQARPRPRLSHAAPAQVRGEVGAGALDASPRVAQLQQMRALLNGAAPVQRATKIVNQGQQYDYGDDTATVGKSMEAWLDPNDMRRGQSANLNRSQNEMMAAIREEWDIVGGDVVKGHLLNDNLGGTALGDNLYPITRGANKDHLTYVENAVKSTNWGGQGAYYAVDVDATPDIDQNMAWFDITLRKWNPKGAYSRSGDLVLGNLTVPSDLEDVRATGEVYDMDDEDMEIDSWSNPSKPKGFQGPKKRVSDLTDMEVEIRDDDW